VTRTRRRVHHDMDAFDAGVEPRDHLEYGGRPVIVSADLTGVWHGAKYASDLSELDGKGWEGRNGWPGLAIESC